MNKTPLAMKLMRRWLQRFIPDAWGYLGPTAKSFKPQSAPWLFRPKESKP